MPFDSTQLRDALGRFPTGVTVVTALAPDGRRIGITVSSFTSLSLEPPLILFCLDQNNPELADLRAAGRFAVNLLGQDQEGLSNTFAMETGDKWQCVASRPSAEGCPLLDGALAAIECRLGDCYPGGDHAILVGQVGTIHPGREGLPLVHYSGAYRRIAED